MEKVRDGQHDDTPPAVRHSDLAKAFFGELKSQLSPSTARTNAAVSSGDGMVHEDQAPYGGQTARAVPTPPLVDLLAEVACEIEGIIRKHAIARWRENADAQNHMRNDLDDLLFALQSDKGVKLSFDQMDAIIESILRIARNRSDV